MSKEVLGTDINGKVDFSLPKMISGQDTTLAALTAQTFTTPPGFNRVSFSCSVGTDIFVSFVETASIPGASVATTTSELNPARRKINIDGGESISVISRTVSDVQLRYDLGG